MPNWRGCVLRFECCTGARSCCTARAASATAPALGTRRQAAPGAGSTRVSRLEKRSWASWPKVDMCHFLAGFLAFVARLLGACNATPWGPWRGARRTAGLCAAAQHPVAAASTPPAHAATPTTPAAAPKQLGAPNMPNGRRRLGRRCQAQPRTRRWRTPRRAQPPRTVPRGCAESQPPRTHGSHAKSRKALLPKSPNFAVFACHALGALAAALSASSKSAYSAAPKIRPGGRLYAPRPPANFLGCH